MTSGYIPGYFRPGGGGGGGGGGVTVHSALTGRDATGQHPATAISVAVTGIAAANLKAALEELLSQITSNSDSIGDLATDFQDADQAHADLPIHSDAYVQVVWDDVGSEWILPKSGLSHTVVSNPKIFLWEAGAPDPSSEKAPRDVVIGDGSV